MDQNTRIIEDARIIDLDVNDSELPIFFNNLAEPINMTLCAGDGFSDGITDIEWFVTKKKGRGYRDQKPTTIFITTKNYNPDTLDINKQYLIDNPNLEVIFLVYNDKTSVWKDNLIKLFSNKINNIYEDDSCYGHILDLQTLKFILKDGGIYHLLADHSKMDKFMGDLHYYKYYWQYFTIDLDNHPRKIIKNNENRLILPSIWEDPTEGYLRNTHYKPTIPNGLTKFNLDKELDKKDVERRKELDIQDHYRRTRFFNRNAGGKKKKTKKSKKIKKRMKSNKTRKEKKSRKH